MPRPGLSGWNLIWHSRNLKNELLDRRRTLNEFYTQSEWQKCLFSQWQSWRTIAMTTNRRKRLQNFASRRKQPETIFSKSVAGRHSTKMALEMRKRPFEAELRKSSKLQSCGLGCHEPTVSPPTTLALKHQNHKGLGKKGPDMLGGHHLISSVLLEKDNTMQSQAYIGLDWMNKSVENWGYSQIYFHESFISHVSGGVYILRFWNILKTIARCRISKTLVAWCCSVKKMDWIWVPARSEVSKG